MKQQTVRYDEMYYGIMSKTWQEKKKEKDSKRKGSSAAMETEINKTETGRKLTDKEYLYCKVNGLCFKCKKINKQIQGLAKEHPNHPKKENVTSSASGSGSGLSSGSGMAKKRRHQRKRLQRLTKPPQRRNKKRRWMMKEQ